MTMKSSINMRLLNPLLLALVLIGAGGCDKHFVEVNTNPVQPLSLDPGYLFTEAQMNTAIQMYYYQIPLSQQLIHPFGGVAEGGNHNVVYDPNTSVTFDLLYSGSNGTTVTPVIGPVALLTDVIHQTKDNPARSNLYNMARIWKAYVFMLLVDSYGDVPYSEAGQAYLGGIALPKYDPQQEIYTDILKELSEASQALDGSKATEAGDLFYKGNIAQWKKLGYSILLRAGMRYSRLDAGKAQQIATAAYAGGTMQSNTDNAAIAFSSSFNNPTGSWFQSTEKANSYLGKPFVDSLQRTNDPRLAVIAVKYDNPGGVLGTGTGAENTNPADQIGMPFGYSDATIVNAPGFPGKATAGWKYSQVNRRTLGRIDIPEFFVTYSQTQLLLAEAAQRGWISFAVDSLYRSGVRAHMDQMKSYDASAAIPLGTENVYLQANPFDAANALAQINTQYWISSFLSGAEAWSNFRRSGYPSLAPNPYPGADPVVKGAFVHRLVYPVREGSSNAKNYNDAVGRSGPDNMATHVFWDK
jgi:hypothetical protein